MRKAAQTMLVVLLVAEAIFTGIVLVDALKLWSAYNTNLDLRSRIRYDPMLSLSHPDLSHSVFLWMDAKIAQLHSAFMEKMGILFASWLVGAGALIVVVKKLKVTEAIYRLGLVLNGIVLVVIGLIAAFYYVELPLFPLFHFVTNARFGYLYQTIGIILTTAGLVALALGVSTHQERLSGQNRMRELTEKL